MNTKAPLLCIAGGGTGGHVMPAVALADAARCRWPTLKVHFIGAERGLEASLLPARGEELLLLNMHAIQGAGLLQKLRVLCYELPKAVLGIRKHWRSARPDLVVGVGGYASVGGIITALISRIPVVLYEQNAIPGLVNRKLARFCRAIMLGFESAVTCLPHPHCVVTGNVVRESITSLQWQSHQPPRLLVMGGSQGALFLNELLPRACHILQTKGCCFVVSHVAGSRNGAVETVKKAYAKAGVSADVMAYCDDMAAFYMHGDFMVARSGAMSVGEASACGMPTLFIPLPHAADQHQYHNAKVLADAGAAVLLEQHEVAAESLAQVLEDTLFDQTLLQDMSDRARSCFNGQSATLQLDLLAEFLPMFNAESVQ
ncbi:MAG: undecaprenyldiphospho-muramoylpentapeptide beta-N-acetylglucosaminyltransferase [Mariprofundaceae bacterium]